MTDSFISPRRRAGRRALACGLYLLGIAACTEDRVGPSTTDAPPAEGSDPGAPSLAILDRRSSRPGIVFGTFNMETQYLNSVHTGWLQGGPLTPSNIVSRIRAARAKGGRVVIKLCKGRDSYVKNRDGTFSLTKWKSLVSQYRNVNLDPYIKDGTIVGHYLIDEPHLAGDWGGKIISPATLEEMARYSKQLWPGMTTMVRTTPSWLASRRSSYRYVDAGWAQYQSGKGDPTKWIRSEVAAAKRRGLGLVVGMNVLHGGEGRRAMTPSEIRRNGAALLAESYGCAFFMWAYDGGYYGRSTIRSAMADVSAKARSHSKTSCRQ